VKLLLILLISLNSWANEASGKFFLDCSERLDKIYYRYSNSEGLVYTSLSYIPLTTDYEFSFTQKIYYLTSINNETYEFIEQVNTPSPLMYKDRLSIDRSSLNVSINSDSAYPRFHKCNLISEKKYWDLAPQRPKNKI
tara:strand:+ start:412 stop:825 length:414 start_codon:yes stop_codon:yes gene_type:complete